MILLISFSEYIFYSNTILKFYSSEFKKKTPLAPLLILEQPNLQICADLFGPMITVDSNKIFVLCITDFFTKCTVVTAIANKDAKTVTDAIYMEWFSKFGIPAHSGKK